MRAYRSMVFGLLVFTGFVAVSSPGEARGQSSSGNSRVARMARFLDSEKRSKAILSYMHMGGSYKEHEILGSLEVVDQDGDRIPGYFAIKVVYDWGTLFGDNSSSAVFIFDETGTLKDINAKTTSVISQPFDIASGAINVVGNVLIQAFGDQMNSTDKEEFQKFVDKSDAKGLLIWSLNFQQRVGL
jgi:hypothetical protein